MLTPVLVGIVLGLSTTLPLAWKWELGVARTAAFTVAAGAASGLVTALARGAAGFGDALSALLVWVLTAGCAAGFLAYRFYRDPERTAAEGEGVIVSPADGEVRYVREVRGGLLPVSDKHGREYALDELTQTPLRTGDATVVGIAMSFLDVHVNRAPIAGRVVLQRHLAGGFGSLKRPEMIFYNERMTTVLECDGLQLAVVQIASRLVRQIVSFVGEGQDVARGERIGVIRFGSQVDLVLPAGPGLRLLVRPGMRLHAGESVVAVVAGRPGDRDGHAAPLARSDEAGGPGVAG
jgi:phosphatidylserine decarboxylase